MALFIDHVSLLKLVLSAKDKQGDYKINILKEIDFGNNFGSLTISQHIHYLFQALIDIHQLYKDKQYIQSQKLTLEQLCSHYKKDRKTDVSTMFYMISSTTEYISYFDMERFICSLPIPIIKQIMSCLFISYEESYQRFFKESLPLHAPLQAPRLSIDTEEKIEDLEAEICYIPRHYGTVDMTGRTTQNSPQPNKMISKLRSCFGFPKCEEYIEVDKEEERKAFFQ